MNKTLFHLRWDGVFYLCSTVYIAHPEMRSHIDRKESQSIISVYPGALNVYVVILIKN
jgi:hypothetical protein